MVTRFVTLTDASTDEPAPQRRRVVREPSVAIFEDPPVDPPVDPRSYDPLAFSRASVQLLRIPSGLWSLAVPSVALYTVEYHSCEA
jgi:hypothetical protein